MIKVMLLDGKDIYVNAELIETIQETPDTIITLTNGKKMIVLDDPQELLQKIVAYKRTIFGITNDDSDYNHYY